VKTASKFVGVAVAYFVAGVLLYRWRHTSEVWLSDSDALVFALPAVLALVANAWIISSLLNTRWHPEIKFAITFGLASVLTFLELWAIMFYALNEYGS